VNKTFARRPTNLKMQKKGGIEAMAGRLVKACSPSKGARG